MRAIGRFVNEVRLSNPDDIDKWIEFVTYLGVGSAKCHPEKN
jgi:hypothetical protein